MDPASSAFDPIHQDLRHVLNEVPDPELGIGIVDLGLIYRAQWTEAGIDVEMTTTVRSCPYASSMREQVERVLRERFSESASVQVRLVYDPPWHFGRLSREALAVLGWTGRAKTPGKRFSLRCWKPAGQAMH